MSNYFVIALIAFVLTACGAPRVADERPAPAPETKSAGAPAVANEWESLIAAARKEGTVVIYTTLKAKATSTIAAAFKDKYGINVEWVAGRGSELVTKVKAERNAGLYLVDFGFIGAGTVTSDLKPIGVTASLEPMLVLPEVKDPNNWREGKLPFLDKEKMAFAISLKANPKYIRNTELVKEGEIRTSLDFLLPKWKEKIGLSDPGIGGSSNEWFQWTLMGILGMEKGQQFMNDLVAQRPALTRDERLLTEWVAKAKYPVGIGPSVAIPAEFIQMGAPVAFIDVNEPRLLSSGAGLINAFKNAPHPNAAKLFLNWILSKEGGAIFVPASEYPSTRVDVPPEGILPILAPRPGDVYAEAVVEGFLERKGEFRQLAADIFGVLLK